MRRESIEGAQPQVCCLRTGKLKDLENSRTDRKKIHDKCV